MKKPSPLSQSLGRASIAAGILAIFALMFGLPWPGTFTIALIGFAAGTVSVTTKLGTNSSYGSIIVLSGAVLLATTVAVPAIAIFGRLPAFEALYGLIPLSLICAVVGGLNIKKSWGSIAFALSALALVIGSFLLYSVTHVRL